MFPLRHVSCSASGSWPAWVARSGASRTRRPLWLARPRFGQPSRASCSPPPAASGAAPHIAAPERRARAPGGGRNCPHRVVPEDPVALLLAVLVERGRLAPAEARGAGRDDGAVGVGEGLAGAVHNAVAQ